MSNKPTTRRGMKEKKKTQDLILDEDGGLSDDEMEQEFSKVAVTTSPGRRNARLTAPLYPTNPSKRGRAENEDPEELLSTVIANQNVILRRREGERKELKILD